jgi:hypothetical protein
MCWRSSARAGCALTAASACGWPPAIAVCALRPSRTSPGSRRIFGCSASLQRAARRRTENSRSELAEHINTHLSALTRLAGNGYTVSRCSVRILSTAENAELAERTGAAVRGPPVEHSRLDHAYYDGIRFLIDVHGPNGDPMLLIDGGAFDWLGKLASNNKLVFVASGMGSQRIAQLFHPR